MIFIWSRKVFYNGYATVTAKLTNSTEYTLLYWIYTDAYVLRNMPPFNTNYRASMKIVFPPPDETNKRH